MIRVRKRSSRRQAPQGAWRYTSRRVGVERTNYVRLEPWLTIDADLAFTSARIPDDDQLGRRFPAHSSASSQPADIRATAAAFRQHHSSTLGPRPLIEDASVTSKSTTLWNGEIELGARVEDIHMHPALPRLTIRVLCWRFAKSVKARTISAARRSRDARILGTETIVDARDRP